MAARRRSKAKSIERSHFEFAQHKNEKHSARAHSDSRTNSKSQRYDFLPPIESAPISRESISSGIKKTDICGAGSDIYSKVLGPTADETLLVGLHLIQRMSSLNGEFSEEYQVTEDPHVEGHISGDYNGGNQIIDVLGNISTSKMGSRQMPVRGSVSDAGSQTESEVLSLSQFPTKMLNDVVGMPLDRQEVDVLRNISTSKMGSRQMPVRDSVTDAGSQTESQVLSRSQFQTKMLNDVEMSFDRQKGFVKEEKIGKNEKDDLSESGSMSSSERTTVQLTKSHKSDLKNSSSSSCTCTNPNGIERKSAVKPKRNICSKCCGKKTSCLKIAESDSANKFKLSCDCYTSTSSALTEIELVANLKQANKGDGHQSEGKIKYAITRITDFGKFTTYEIMKSTRKKPKTIPKRGSVIEIMKAVSEWILDHLIVFLTIQYSLQTNSGNGYTSYEKQTMGSTIPSDNSHEKQLSRKDEKDEFSFLGLLNKDDLDSSTYSVEGKNSDRGHVVKSSDIDNAIEFGIDSADKLITEQEPIWYKMGLFLNKDHPASRVADFGKPNKKALKLSKFGFATLEASRKIAQSFPGNLSHQFPDFPSLAKSRILKDDCPLKGNPRCPLATRRYRTADGTCNNLAEPWKGSALLPLQRFLPPVYDDGIQSMRRSVRGRRLPSAREISVNIHRERDQELQSVTLMFMQWGQFIDHDITSVVKSISFNGSIPRCCDRGGRRMLPPELTHPSCLPIAISADDWFFGKLGMRCMEFIRSAPSTRIDCDLGWREQINQVTPFIDASTIYGSDIETSDDMRSFRNGKISYGRHEDGQLQPPDPPGGELCRAGALTTDCFQPGDGRVAEQPGLTALHTVWIRFHNKVATVLSRHNPHWSDEKVFQETRKIVYSLIQHITYREFLPILLGPEVVELFELDLMPRGYYDGYNAKVDPAIANSFSAAAYRFGHSMVQNSFVRTDPKHRPIFNNVSLHEEMDNFENIWSFGSVDRLLLGFSNQPSQRRDEFICDELTNHLFQSFNAPFGMDLTAINIQRGRDHGIPPYTSWRQPCGLSPVKDWGDLKKIFNGDTVERFRRVYRHVDDIDLFSGGLAEKPVRGGVIGPTFGCIIAQQFLNLRKGDRFWYENGEFQSSFTPAQLQQIRRVTFSNILCQTMDEIETIQTFVFLSPDDLHNVRVPCDSISMKTLDLSPWIETNFKDIDNRKGFDFGREGTDSLEESETLSRGRQRKTNVRNKAKGQTSAAKKTKNSKNPAAKYPDNIRNNNIHKKIPTANPIEVNIKIQYFLPKTTTTSTTMRPRKKKKRPTTRPTLNNLDNEPYFRPSTIKYPENNAVNIQSNSYDSRPIIRPSFMYDRPDDYISSLYRPSAPSNLNNYNIYDRPSSSDDYSSPGNRPTQIKKRPVTVDNYNSFNNRPTQIFNRPTSLDEYNTNDFRPTHSYNKPSNSENSYGSISNNRPVSNYDNLVYSFNNDGTEKPKPGYEVYDEVIFESELFSTSQRPYIYKPSSNSHVYNVYNSQRPQQNNYDNDIPNYFYSQYDRFDKLDDIPKRPNFGATTHMTDSIRKPSNIFTISKGNSQGGSQINDKLDFKTKLVNKVNQPDDTRFVKISSVHAEAMLSSSNAYFNTVLQREGDADIYADEDTNDRENGESLRLVDIDVAPSEMNDNWLIYNETEDPLPMVKMPEFNPHTSCSEEIPKPMKLLEKEQDS
ncbi:hypothetical protein JTB14_033465 [Gonioctena quinquepunctata]|nr:hypothetical protein JTB14_033465 [Gonioctena quinquepunctata]